MTSPIKVIFFDAGGTLFRPYPSVGAVYSRVAATHGVHVEAGHVEKAFHDRWHLRNSMAEKGSDPTATATGGQTPFRTSEKIERDWWYQMVTDVFSGTPFRDFDAFFRELYDLFARAECWRLFEDTVPVLDELKTAGFRLGMISNWDHRLFSILEQLGLASYFEQVTASSVVGTAKPGKRIFESALQAMKVQADESLHVGDSMEDDYWGASRAGLQAVLLRRQNPTLPSPPPSPDMHVGRGRGEAAGEGAFKRYNNVVTIAALHELSELLA